MEPLLVAATHAEAAHLPDRLPVVVTGPGKTAAAAGTAAALARQRRAEDVLVVNLGTAGALRDEMEGLILPARVINHDFSAEAIRSMGVEAVDSLALDAPGDVVLATGDSFIESAVERQRLAAHAHLVDMEGFAVAYAAVAAGAQVLCVKHVSDGAADTARDDWPSAVDASARALARWVAENL